MAGRIAVKVVVTGEVQGVGFRAFLRDEAQAAGVGGWCRNRYDGAVEALFCGESAGVELLLDACRRGPRWSEVQDVSVEREVADPGGVQFRVTG